MDKKKQLISQVMDEYLSTLQDAHKKWGYDTDILLNERIIVLMCCEQCNNADAFIKLLETWITERHSLIVYFCSQNLIEKSLEAIIVSYEKNSKEIGIDENTIAIAKERLKQVKNGMEDPNVKQEMVL